MEHSIPTVTPNRGSSLAVDDTRPDATPIQPPKAEAAAKDSAPPRAEAGPGSGVEAGAAAQPRVGLKVTANTGDLVEIGSMLFQEAEAILRSGQKKRLKVRIGRRTVAEMPLNTGAIGVMVAAMAAVALSRLTVEVE